MVVDADALFELEPESGRRRVLTPHEGELARLLGRESKEIAAHRLASVQEAAEKFRAVVVLKGELLARRRRRRPPSANSALPSSRGGTATSLPASPPSSRGDGGAARRQACAAQQLAS
jgi:hypothetical protein